PLSLSNDEVYAVTAYLLYLNGIVAENALMNAQTLPQVTMPNRDGFVDWARQLPRALPSFLLRVTGDTGVTLSEDRDTLQKRSREPASALAGAQTHPAWRAR